MPFEATALNECDPCVFDEVEIQPGDFEDGDVLQSGMKVLVPCKGCGTTPLIELEWYAETLESTQSALDKLLVDKDMPLFHWAPVARRKQIIRYGLRPRMRPATHLGDLADGWRAPYICFGDDPAWAWALSGGQRGATPGQWDLWQTYASRLTDPHVLPGYVENGIHEVRTEHRVYKRHLKLVAHRTKDPR